MNYLNEELRILQEQISEKGKAESTLKDLDMQRMDLEDKVWELKQIKWTEQKDVDKLEKTTLTAIFYEITGQKEERLSKERQEAYAATVKYDSAVRELEYVNDTIQSTKMKLARIERAEEKYEKLLEEQMVRIRTSGDDRAEDILKLEQQITVFENQKKEIREAISAGNRAKSRANDASKALDEAESLGTWDAFGGNSIFLHMEKNDRLDFAQDAIESLQLELRRFKTELADIRIEADIKVNLTDFTRFADWFFDNIFTDFEILDQIRASQSKLSGINVQIDRIIINLEKKETQVDMQIAGLKKQVADIVLQITS